MLSMYIRKFQKFLHLRSDTILTNGTQFSIELKSLLFPHRTSVECSDNIQSLNIFPDRDKFESYMRRTSLAGPHRLSDSGLFQSQKAKAAKASAPKVRLILLN